MAGVGLFDRQASSYALARPLYPDSLYDFITALTPHRAKAWDVGTGNGQAALALADRFDHVIATDVSEEQLARAPRRSNVTYASTPSNLTIEDARRIVGDDSSVDLITVAQALHWFDLDAFHSLASQMLRKPGGICAAWTYYLVRVDADVDAITDKLYSDTKPYWAAEREYVDKEYRTISFPYVAPAGLESTGPFEFQTTQELNLEGLLLYFRSWSAVQTALNAGVDFIANFKEAFEKAWGGDAREVKKVSWPVYLRIGTVDLHIK